MNLNTGLFDHTDLHHEGWFKVYRVKGLVEIWFGKRWIIIEWR